MLAGQTFREDAHLGPRPPVQVLDLGATATPESPEPGPPTWWDLMHGNAPAPHTQVQEEPSLPTLTDAGFRAGEAPVLGHHVGIVALAGQHLRHLRSPLPLPHLGLQENPEADVPSVRRELPPAGDMAPLTATCLGSRPLSTTPRCVWGAQCPPEHAAREQDLVVHLQGGASAHGRLVVVLHPHVVAQVVMLGHVAPVVDLQARVVSGHRTTAISPPCLSSGHRTLVRHLGLPSGSVMVPPNSTGSWSGLMNFSNSCFQLPVGTKVGLCGGVRGSTEGSGAKSRAVLSI